MALKNFVKINQVSSLSDARYCAGMGVDILGFSLVEGSQAYVSPEQFKEITQWVSGPKFAGEFNDTGIEEIKLAVLDYSLDIIETSVPDHLEQFSAFNSSTIFRYSIQNEDDIRSLNEILTYGAELINYLHLEINGDTLKQFKSHIPDFKTPLIIGMDSPSKNLSLLDGHGIALTAHLEDQTGLQDYGEIMDVLEAIEIDD